MGVVGDAVPGPVEAAERLLHHVLGRLPVTEHQECEPRQAQRMPPVEGRDRLAGVGLTIHRVIVRASPARRHNCADRDRAADIGAAARARFDLHISKDASAAQRLLRRRLASAALRLQIRLQTARKRAPSMIGRGP